MLLKGLRACKQGVTQSDYVCPPALMQHTDDQSIYDIGTKHVVTVEYIHTLLHVTVALMDMLDVGWATSVD